MRERVLRLALPDGLDPGMTLELAVDHPEVVLAVRAPGCAPGEELVCAPATPGGAVALVEGVDALAGAGIAPYLFIELPDAVTGDDPPIAVTYAFSSP
jgi:hypothetical protein